MTLQHGFRASFFSLVLLIGLQSPALLARSTPTDNQERVCARLLELAERNLRLELSRAEHEKSGTIFLRGSFSVFENRSLGQGREIRLGLIVLPARRDDAAPDPVFILHGGPGAAATSRSA